MIWLIGASGMLGRELASGLERESFPFYSSDLDVDVTDTAALQRYVEGKKIHWIVNASGYTAVDRAEEEVEKAFSINAGGVENIAELAQKINAKVIHFSTDYVFSGKKEAPYLEGDVTDPVSAYGRTKLAGEHALQKVTDRYFILRISWLYGQFGPNFVSTMLRLFNERDQLGIVDDQIGAPTRTRTLAENVVRLIQSDSQEYGIYHYSDDGAISWYEFACAIFEESSMIRQAKNNVRINAISTEEYLTPVQRPANSCFDKAKVKKLGFQVRDWRENLREYLKEAYFQD